MRTHQKGSQSNAKNAREAEKKAEDASVIGQMMQGTAQASETAETISKMRRESKDRRGLC